ncbi:coenzyme F420-reducing hydrogenase subunit beta [Aerococcus viridans]|uniref:Coenzyme F420 hydrogenase n=2 Tax=Aerococcus viridans TaxID=1377 RepID=A0AAU8U5G4_9LACT|nr:Coenzyme F420 hydrogenase/dehydrogenase, beta subunit C-terminal domain [Aerococcus viridans]AMC01365.1 coenzyme F420 hydrogenase [Aerococcus viridans]EFG50326.1 hypothetical protein HMPREF0061_0332 [Aerococcus viridans ATCC 11563 = CCUG 4311]SUU15774.1 coenzyme F420-reducing hydrogenase subunit beta [Aerococcus viridans]
MDTENFLINKKYSEASGSMAVVDENIVMEFNSYGLYEEKILDPSKKLSATAEFVSPNFNTEFNESIVSSELYKKQKGIHFDERIGFYNSLLIGHVNEGDFRELASSGGMGTWIFKELFDNNLIDYVIHVKRNVSSQNKILFKYDISYNLEEIKAGAKTKYYPVEFSEVIKQVKEIPGRYAIVGIPSFIYAIRLLAKQDKTIADRIKYTVGLICGHQKSSKFAESMAWQVGIKPGNLIDIDFRYKLLDKPANRYGIKMTGLINGKESTIIKANSELYGQNWGWGLFKPVASNFTDDVFNETADIVLGDAWLPEYTTDSKGTNIVIVRNDKIRTLIETAMSEGRLIMDRVDKEKIFESQLSHYRHTHDELAYRLFEADRAGEWRPKKRVKPNQNLSQFRKQVQDLRKNISNSSHVEYSKAVEKNNYKYFVDQLSKYTNKYTAIYIKKSRKKMLKDLGFIGVIRKVFKKLKRI